MVVSLFVNIGMDKLTINLMPVLLHCKKKDCWSMLISWKGKNRRKYKILSIKSKGKYKK